MKKLITLVSVLLLVGCGGDGSNTTAGAGSATDSVALGKFRPDKDTAVDPITGEKVTASCKLVRDTEKVNLLDYTNWPDEYFPGFFAECTFHSTSGIRRIWSLSDLLLYSHNQGPIPKKVKVITGAQDSYFIDVYTSQCRVRFSPEYDFGKNTPTMDLYSWEIDCDV